MHVHTLPKNSQSSGMNSYHEEVCGAEMMNIDSYKAFLLLPSKYGLYLFSFPLNLFITKNFWWKHLPQFCQKLSHKYAIALT